MLRIGLLGGTFDPVHNGHLLAAQAAHEAAKLDEVWFIPTLMPPHKSQPGADGDKRRQMLEAAIAGNPVFRVEDIELRREGTSYTIDTVTALQDQHPEVQFYWIVGSDMVSDLPNWRKIDELADRLSFIGLERPDQAGDDSLLPSFIRRRLHRAAMPPMGISSSEIRRRCKEGRSIRYMVPDPVLEFIQRNELYES
ncbi:nicotinate-nucleotide adenylyltransferase [Cohnella luojiensis]|uniref:Probable nicotinate-nucleotide adenylyltransferase n=1 Tax=Cohnella luojiensis TaxID=652876 RepID=A0A4Y8M6K1_9BACL|nr:nicotinate-nucleotide adenylyltransferase [Cohnella luojiensis]TFE31626.1 nicotinate-nucleotide adenylyltransferase [Cohnella luojiensis]